MTFDLCFATYNSQKWLAQCLKALSEVCYDKKNINLYFADNASTDYTLETLYQLQKQFAHVFGAFEVLPQPQNKGFGTASNAAARAGHGEYVFFYNVDTEIFPDAFQNLEKSIAASDVEFCAFELRQFPYEHPKYYDPVTLETSWSSGACFVLRRDVFEKTGGFDESIFMYAEDVELSWRLRALGYKIKYVPSAVTMHYAYQSAYEEKPMQLVGSAIGNLMLRYKYGSPKDIQEGEKLYEQIEPRLKVTPQMENTVEMQLTQIRKNKKKYRDFYKNTVKKSSFKPLFLEFDYEFARAGAFYENHLPQTTLEITVVIRTFQRPDLLALTLQSLRHQTYSHFKVIVVEDGEKPMAQAVVQQASEWLDIQYIAANAAWGRCKAGNKGIEAATTDYICFLDDDDYFFADYMETMVCMIEENSQCKLFFAGSIEGACLTKNEDKTDYTFVRKWNKTYKNLRLIDFYLDNPVSIQAVVFKRELYYTLGGLDETLEALEDWDLWMRYVSNVSFAAIEKATSIYKVPATEEEYENRDEFISSYRMRVFEKMENYHTEISAQDVYGLLWTPEQMKKKAQEKIEFEETKSSAKEICSSTSWKITMPLRAIPALMRLVFKVAYWSLQKLFQVLLGVLKFLEKMTESIFLFLFRALDWVGPANPDFETGNTAKFRAFIILSRKSLSWHLAKRIQKWRKNN